MRTTTKHAEPKAGGDPCPYTGPIARADGVKPWNMYLWPTESWWANRELGHSFSSSWEFSIVGLADGRFAVEGFVRAIEENDYCGQPIVFTTRALAIRTAAARLIRRARASGSWDYNLETVTGAKLGELINWIRKIVAKETGKPEPRPVHIEDPVVAPKRETAGLPLFDRAESNSKP